MLSEDIQKHGSQGCRTDAWRKMYDEWADEVAKYERVAQAAKDLVHPDHPEYDWPSGSTEYEARRRRLREALADLPEDALGG